jgi:hypothetical protein
MSKFLDYVEQPDGTFKWQLAEIPAVKSQSIKTEKVVNNDKSEVQKTTDFESMTKKELEVFGRSIGLELDKRHNKADLIAELKKFTSPE